MKSRWWYCRVCQVLHPGSLSSSWEFIQEHKSCHYKPTAQGAHILYTAVSSLPWDEGLQLLTAGKATSTSSLTELLALKAVAAQE